MRTRGQVLPDATRDFRHYQNSSLEPKILFFCIPMNVDYLRGRNSMPAGVYRQIAYSDSNQSSSPSSSLFLLAAATLLCSAVRGKKAIRSSSSWAANVEP